MRGHPWCVVNEVGVRSPRDAGPSGWLSGSGTGGAMTGRKRWMIVVAVCAPVAVVLAMCGWVSTRVSPTAFGCTPPAGEDALIARYRADPLLRDTSPVSATPRGPFIRRY